MNNSLPPQPASQNNPRRHLRLLVCIAVFLLLSIVTILLLVRFYRTARSESAREFGLIANQTTQLIEERMSSRATLLMPLRPLLTTTQDIDYVAKQSQIFTLSPSLLAIAVVNTASTSSTINSTSRNEYSYKEIFDISEHKEAMDRAISLKVPSISRNVEIHGAEKSIGVLVFMPIANSNGADSTKVLIGLFDLGKLLSNTILMPDISFEIYSDSELLQVITQTHSCLQLPCGIDKKAYPQRITQTISMGGKDFSLVYYATQYFGLLKNMNVYVRTLTILGIFGNFLIVTIIYLLGSSYVRSLDLAMKMTGELRSNERKYRTIFETFQDIYFEADENRLITTITPSVETILGIKPGDLIGKKLEELIPVESQRVELTRALQANSVIDDFELSLINSKSETKSFSLDAKLNIEESGISQVIGVLHDISERKKQRESIQTRTEELEKINAILLDREAKMAEIKEENVRLRGKNVV